MTFIIKKKKKLKKYFLPHSLFQTMLHKQRKELFILFFLFLYCFDCVYVGGENIIKDPQELKWKRNVDGSYYGEIYFGAIETEINDLGTLVTRTYGIKRGNKIHYSIPSPTLRFTRGKTYNLLLINDLEPVEINPEHNVLKNPNVTNIHTHGLHISGEGNSDNVYVSVNGGEKFQYTYEIAENQLSGNYFYHPHSHGSTYLQVGGGAVGPVIVNDDPKEEMVPASFVEMKERIFVIGKIINVTGVGGDELFWTDIEDPFWTVNGIYKGTVEMQKDEWQRYRIVVSDPFAGPRTLQIGTPETCQVVLLSRDGLFRSTVPQNLSENSIILTGASRVGFGVKCTEIGTTSIIMEDVAVAQINVVDYRKPNTFASPYDPDGSVWKPQFPEYMHNLLDIDPNGDTKKIFISPTAVNFESFDPEIPFSTVPLNSINEFTLVNSNGHPFHLHIYPFQIMSKDCPGFDYGEFYDTISAFSPTGCRIRFYAYNIPGKAMMHCHIVLHEDNGAMSFLYVDDSDPLPPLPPDTPYLFIE
eukprot:TRINITY_DN791_c0_g1_i2.p1 TRINITY_DN791_c0_g1~~TRINITY_DN791_c0_g1_i2.p1  ORF type:complete len:528 (+),score=159.44 TRINITY_DN791_c0_g1_i2:56-1639(+)